MNTLRSRRRQPIPDGFILGNAIASVDHKEVMKNEVFGVHWYTVKYKENVMEWEPRSSKWVFNGLHISDFTHWWYLPKHHKCELYYGYDSIEELLVIRTLEKHSNY